jgi:hypothetical protein
MCGGLLTSILFLQQIDFYAITMRYDEELRRFQEQAAARFERESKKDGELVFLSSSGLSFRPTRAETWADLATDAGCVFRSGLLPL